MSLWSLLSLFLRSSYAAVACVIFVASMPEYYKRVSFAIRFSAKRPETCDHCGEKHAHSVGEAAGFILIETIRLLLGAVGWFFYLADSMLDRAEGKDD